MKWLRRLFRRPAPHWPKPVYVYLLYDMVDRLLYVGITVNPKIRIAQHRRHQRWGGEIHRTLVHRIPSHTDPFMLEQAVIRRLNPIHNKIRW